MRVSSGVAGTSTTGSATFALRDLPPKTRGSPRRLVGTLVVLTGEGAKGWLGRSAGRRFAVTAETFCPVKDPQAEPTVNDAANAADGILFLANLPPSPRNTEWPLTAEIVLEQRHYFLPKSHSRQEQLQQTFPQREYSFEGSRATAASLMLRDFGLAVEKLGCSVSPGKGA